MHHLKGAPELGRSIHWCQRFQEFVSKGSLFDRLLICIIIIKQLKRSASTMRVESHHLFEQVDRVRGRALEIRGWKGQILKCVWLRYVWSDQLFL